MDLNSITGMVSKIITPDMYPMIGFALVVAVALVVLRAVIRMLVRVAIIAGLVLVGLFFFSGSAGVTATGPFNPSGVESFVGQVAKNLPDFSKMFQSSTSSAGVAAPQTVDPTPYMDVQSTYQNIVSQLKGVQATAGMK